jgi:hypothetical protein
VKAGQLGRAFLGTKHTTSRLLHAATNLMETIDGGYGAPKHITTNMNEHLHHVGTSQLPLAGAVLCCTSIAPEQRVCIDLLYVKIMF